MVRRHEAQLSIAQLVLFGVVIPKPEELMDPVLRRINELLDDEELVGQVLALLRRRWPKSASRGRPGTPAEVVLRLFALKHLRDWSYDGLEREVAGSLVYRRFCRIDAGKVPDAKTMIRLGQLLGEPVLRELLNRLVELAVEKKVTRGRKMRVDTTVTEANIRHPTDSGLCEDVVRVLRREMRRLLELGIRVSFRFRDVRRSVSRRMWEIAQAARRRGEQARKAIVKPYKGLLRVTKRIVRQAATTIDSARSQVEALDESVRRAVARGVEKIAAMLPRARQVIRQTRMRVVRGVTDSDGKLVSVFEPHAQILRRGKPHRPTEFGALVKIQEAEGGIVTDVGLVPEKADAPLLVPSVQRHKEQFGRVPDLVSTDRGFYSTDGEAEVRRMGVRRAVLPKPGYRSPERILYEKQRWFRRGRAWRAGGEARIGRLKNCFGMARSRYRGEAGMIRTVYLAAIANNLVAIGARSASERRS